MKAINQTSNLVHMNSLGNSYENRQQYLLKVCFFNYFYNCNTNKETHLLEDHVNYNWKP